MAVGYFTGATQGVDDFDGKYYNDGAIALSSILDNSDYAIQGRALPFDGTDIVPLNFTVTTSGTSPTVTIESLLSAETREQIREIQGLTGLSTVAKYMCF